MDYSTTNTPAPAPSGTTPASDTTAQDNIIALQASLEELKLKLGLLVTPGEDWDAMDDKQKMAYATKYGPEEATRLIRESNDRKRKRAKYGL